MTNVPSCRILLLNANTTVSMTKSLCQRAQEVCRAGTEIVATEPAWGPATVESWYDAHLSAAAMLERIEGWTEPFDGLVVAGFGDLGRDALRERLAVPVVDITESAVMAAQLIGSRYGVITTAESTVPLIRASLAAAGQGTRCACVRALGISVSDVAGGSDALAERFVEASAAAVADGAESLCLGSAALSTFWALLGGLVAVPVVDAVASAVALCESLVHLGLRTSPIGAWAAVAEKPRPGWPTSAS